MTAFLVLCSVCRSRCRWVDDAWVCTRRSCGAEWVRDHGPEYDVPGADTDNARLRPAFGSGCVKCHGTGHLEWEVVGRSGDVGQRGMNCPECDGSGRESGPAGETPAETTRRRLLWGERVEALVYASEFGALLPDGGVAVGLEWALSQITREPDEPCDFDHPHPDHPCGRQVEP